MTFDLHRRAGTRPDGAWLAVLGLAAGLRLAAVLWLGDTIPYTDYFCYHEAGRMQAADPGFYFRPGAQASFGELQWWPPGYPFFLAAIYTVFGPSFRVAAGLQVGLGTLVCALMGAIGVRAAGRTVGLLTAFLVAVNPTYVFTTNLIASENLFVFWMALGWWLAGKTTAHRRRASLLAGLAFGAAILTRAAGLCLVPVVALWRLRHGAEARAAALAIVLGSAIVVAPWTLRNTLVTGHPNLVAAGGGLNFYFGHQEGPLGYRDPARTPLAGLHDPAAIDRAAWSLAWRHIADAPLGVVTRGARKLVALFAPPTYALHANSAILIPDPASDPTQAPVAAALRQKQARKDRLLHGPLRVLAALHSYLLLGGALAASVFGWRRLPGELRLGVWLAVAWIGVHLVFWGQPRFRYPMELPLALLAAWALVWPPARVPETPVSEAP